MPPVTPRATFIGSFHRQLRAELSQRAWGILKHASHESPSVLGVVPESLIKNLGRLLGRAASFRNLPLHLTRADFILRNAAGFARVGLHHRRSAGLKLAGAPRRYQNVAIVAVEAFDQFHGVSPLLLATRF